MVSEISWIEWFGYAASVVVAISLTMSSIVRLRWFNLVGSLMFSIYGFIIGALPVGFLNLFIAIINVVYLVRMHQEKDDFRIMSLSGDGEYLRYFLASHQKEIRRFFPQFDIAAGMAGRSAFYLVKNSVPIGVLIGQKAVDGSFLIELDYVGPQFRDFRMGSFIYEKNDFFRTQGFRSLRAAVTGGSHDRYLERMGFTREGAFFTKSL